MSGPDSGTEAFARRLREMRDRSGRSYGALARRVGVSASTLHRYCSGHTVPMEFAPIERLARLCGCRGEDLISLHRLWVRADADRRRRQENATTRPDTPPQDPAAAPDASDASDTSGVSDTRAPASGEDPAAATQGHGGAAAVEPAAVEPADGPGAPGAAPQPVRVHWVRRQRRRAVFASAAVVATAVTLGLLMAFDRSPLSATEKPRTTARQPDRASVSPFPSPSLTDS
ncbi:helix-turn-helix domain-containing protein, partial [Streptomyces sp. NPDC055078]